MRRTPWWSVLLVVLAGIVVGIAGGRYLAYYVPILEHTNTSVKDIIKSNPWPEYVRFLLIGEDDTGGKKGNGLSDTIVVMTVNTKTHEVRAISIPRDTRVEIPNHGVGKINSAHVFGGPELTKEVVENILNEPIDYYIKTNTRGLKGMVDLLGGVYIVVDKNMKYTDRSAGLRINLKASPEKQLLNGEQAEGYVRFRHDRWGDSGYEIVDGKKVPRGRVVRQQIFMRALANRVLSLPSKRERADFLRKCYENEYVVTNMNLRDWDLLADSIKDLMPEQMVMDVLPGKPQNIGGGSYWVLDEEAVRQMVATHIRFEPITTPAKVEVLNGSGIAGAATKVASVLEAAGFDVTRTDNADGFDYEKCRIIAKSSDSEPVQRIAKIIGCTDIEEAAIREGAVDVTVIVGRDFRID
ncbi:MAG: LCP family protein [Armatimonadota bacterium]